MPRITTARSVRAIGAAVGVSLILAACAGPAPAAQPDSEVAGPSPTPESVDYEAPPWPDIDRPSCISVIDGLSPVEAIDTLTGGPEIELAGEDEAVDWAYFAEPVGESTLYRAWVASGTIDGHTFLWGDNTFDCADPEVASRLSRHGTFISEYWNLDASTNLTYARDGDVLVQTEQWAPPDQLQWPVLVEAGATRIGDEQWDTAMEFAGLTVQAEIMGLGEIANPEWLELPGTRFWGTRVY